LKIEWHNEKVLIKNISAYENNPRKLSEKQYEDLKKSLEKFNLAEVPVIDFDDKIIAGHQRIKILNDLYGPEYELDVRRPNRKLTDSEFEEYLVRSNKNTGSWDMDKLLESFDQQDLLDWGFDENELKVNDNWESDIDSIGKVDENLDGIKGKITLTCSQDDKDALLIFLKGKLMESSFEGVHIA
jgi:hypothetical protein